MVATIDLLGRRVVMADEAAEAEATAAAAAGGGDTVQGRAAAAGEAALRAAKATLEEAPQVGQPG